MEILITAVLIIAATYIIFKNIKKSSKGGGCSNCSGCASKCDKYKK